MVKIIQLKFFLSKMDPKETALFFYKTHEGKV